MSESLFWLDHVLFAMVPLGIIAAVTGAIRTQGPRIAKAFIGRVRENDAQVEFELLSSTSHEVGEAFNGRGIVRVLGKPTIATFLVFPKQYEEFDRQIKSDPLGQGTDVLESCGIHSLETVVNGQAPLMSLERQSSAIPLVGSAKTNTLMSQSTGALPLNSSDLPSVVLLAYVSTTSFLDLQRQTKRRRTLKQPQAKRQGKQMPTINMRIKIQSGRVISDNSLDLPTLS